MISNRPVRASNFTPKVALSGGIPLGVGFPQAELKYEFVNTTPYDVFVTTRTGVCIKIPFIGNRRSNGFIIRTTYRVGGNVKADSLDLLNDEGKSTSKEAELLEAAFSEDPYSPYAKQPCTTSIEYIIYNTDFHENGGAVYIPSLDLSVSILNRNFSPKHPASNVGVRENFIQNDPSFNSIEIFNYQIRIIDRHKRFGDRFININGEVFHIRAISDSEMPDGVYLTSHSPVNGEIDSAMPRSEIYRFDDADKKLSLYLTYNEAKTLGNPNDVYKRELEEKAHFLKTEDHRIKSDKLKRDSEWEIQKREFELEREKNKNLQFEREEQVRLREYELSRQEQDYRLKEAQLKRDTLLLKDVFENRSAARKEFLEVLKYIPVVITTITGILVIVKKLKT